MNVLSLPPLILYPRLSLYGAWRRRFRPRKVSAQPCSTAHWLIKTTKSSAGDPHAKEKDLAATKDAGEFLRAN